MSTREAERTEGTEASVEGTVRYARGMAGRRCARLKAFPTRLARGPQIWALLDPLGKVQLRTACCAAACLPVEEDGAKTQKRFGAAEEEIAALVRRKVAGEWEGSEIQSAKLVAPPWPMYSIGG